MEQKLQPLEPADAQIVCQTTLTKGGYDDDACLSPLGPEKASNGTEDTTDIVLWVRSLRHDSPIRALALEALAGKPPSTKQPLLDMLADPVPNRWRECAVAAWVLGHFPSLEAEEQRFETQRLCQVLGNQGKPLGKRSWQHLVRSLPVSGGGGLLITLMFLVYGVRYHIPMEHGFRFILAGILGVLVYTILCSPFLLPLSIAYDRKRSNRVRSAAAIALGKIRSPESLGVLARSAADRSRPVRMAAQAALRQVLPMVTRAHYGQLGSETVSCLCKVLQDTDEPLVLAVMDALRLIGDGNAISTVSRLTAHGRTENVRQAATLLLPILQERREEENASKMLLRASQASQYSPALLLRPTSGPSETDERELLRSGSASEETR